MSIIKWVPDFESNTDLEKWFFGQDQAHMRAMTPAMDVYETKDAVVVETAIPGFDPEKVDIQVEDNLLTISGKSEKKKEVEDKNYLRQEVRYGQFQRTVAMPVKVEGEKAEATYADGVLKITVPKAGEVKRKSIKINVTK